MKTSRLHLKISVYFLIYSFNMDWDVGGMDKLGQYTCFNFFTYNILLPPYHTMVLNLPLIMLILRPVLLQYASLLFIYYLLWMAMHSDSHMRMLGVTGFELYNHHH